MFGMTTQPTRQRYIVHVDDNFQYMDDGARRKYGDYPDAESALAACRHIVDLCLQEVYKPGMTAEALINAYRMFGDDPSSCQPMEPPRVSFRRGATPRNALAISARRPMRNDHMPSASSSGRYSDMSLSLSCAGSMSETPVA
jgi:hypothetical protein